MNRTHLSLAALFILASALSAAAAFTLATRNEAEQCRARIEKAFALKSQDLASLSRIETHALAEWSRLKSITPSEAMVGRRVITTSKGDGRCVIIALEAGALGGSPMYCYDAAGKLIERYDRVE